MIPMTLYNIGSGVLRAVGDSKTPLACLVVTVVLNIGLDLLFVGPLGMGVAGAALATALAQLAAAVLIVIILLRADPIYGCGQRESVFMPRHSGILCVSACPPGCSPPCIPFPI